MMRHSMDPDAAQEVRKEKPRAGRTNISVDQAVFQEFAAEAERQNKTLFAFASESLLEVARITEQGGTSSDLYSMWRTVSLLKELEVVTLPSDFVDDLVAKQYSLDRDGVLRAFRDLGSRMVGVLKIVASGLDDLEVVAKNFTALLLPIKEFKIRNRKDGSVEIGIVGAGRRMESTECAFEFLVSILNGYGYGVTESEINVGTIKLLAAKKAQP